MAFERKSDGRHELGITPYLTTGRTCRSCGDGQVQDAKAHRCLVQSVEHRKQGKPGNLSTVGHNRNSCTHFVVVANGCLAVLILSLIHISEPTRQAEISYAVFC